MKFADLFKKRSPQNLLVEAGAEIAEVPCEAKDGAAAKIVIRGFDSYYPNSAPTKNLFVRRYKLQLRFEDGQQADRFMEISGTPESAKQLSGDINLGILPGESELVALSTDNLAQGLKSDGVTVDPSALFDAIMADRALHQDKYNKPASEEIINSGKSR